MPKQTQQRLSEGSADAGYAVTTVNPMPLQFRQVLSDAPDGMRVSTQPPAIQLTRKSIRKSIKRNAVIAQHWLNLPLTDGVISVSRIYKTLEAMAFNYQRVNQNAFFEVYPDLVILSDAERADEDKYLTTHALRRDYRKYCKRAAHYAWQYGEAKKMQIGSLANLLLLTRLNGNEVMKFIASDLRWPRINTRCNLYDKSPVPVGAEAYIFGNSRYAVGTTTYGADIVSFPLWITDIWGNRGQHGMDINSMYSEALESREITFGSKSYPTAPTLIKRMHQTAQKFGYSRGDDEVSPIDPVPPSMPHVENGARITMSDGNTIWHAALNQDGVTDKIQGAFHTEDNLVGRLWHNFDYWTKYITLAFPEMMDPNSDFYVMFTREIKMFQKASNLDDALKAVRDLQNVDAASLAQHMFYKARGKTTSASLIKWSPMMYASDAEITSDFKDVTVFSDNYERYEVDDNNTTAMLYQARNWPKLTPTICCQKDRKPFVVNATAEWGYVQTNTNENGENDKYLYTLSGRDAVLFDLAKHSDVGQELKSIDFIGVTDAFAMGEMVIDPADGVFVFEEYPTDLFMQTQPLIDNTDIYQCGFNVMISAGDPNPNEWDMAISSGVYASLKMTSDKLKDTVGLVNVTGAAGNETVSPIWKDVDKQSDANGNTAYKHAGNQDYLNFMKHLFVFVGGGIFQHPLVMFANKSSGFFTNKYSSSSGEDGVTKVKEFFANGFGETPNDDIVNYTLESGDYTSNISVKSGEKISIVAPKSSLRGMFGELTQLSSNADVLLEFYTFAPEYGPVLPIIEEFPFANIADQVPYLGSYRNSQWEDGDDAPFHGKIEPKTYFYKMGGVNNGTTNPQNNGVDPITMSGYVSFYNRKDVPAAFVKYFIAGIHLPNVLVDPITGLCTYDESKMIDIDMAEDWKWIFSTMAKQVAQFAGSLMTKPFWDKGDKVQLVVPDLSAAPSFPENNIMALPRIARKVVDSARGFGHSRGPRRSQLSSESENATYGSSEAEKGIAKEFVDSESSKSSKYFSKSSKRGGKASLGRRSFKPKSDDINSSLINRMDGVLEDKKQDSLLSNIAAGKSEVSDKTELNFKKAKSKPVDSTTTQLSD